MAEFNFNADEELFSRLPEKAFYTVVDNKVVSADGNIGGGYICAIGDRITMQHLGMIKELADRSGVSFAFREPFAICGKQVLIAVTDRYSVNFLERTKRYFQIQKIQS